jgi:hypothetical protein
VKEVFVGSARRVDCGIIELEPEWAVEILTEGLELRPDELAYQRLECSGPKGTRVYEIERAVSADGDSGVLRLFLTKGADGGFLGHVRGEKEGETESLEWPAEEPSAIVVSRDVEGLPFVLDGLGRYRSATSNEHRLRVVRQGTEALIIGWSWMGIDHIIRNTLVHTQPEAVMRFRAPVGAEGWWSRTRSRPRTLEEGETFPLTKTEATVVVGG